MIREIGNWISDFLGKELTHIQTSTQFIWDIGDGKVVKLLPYCMEDHQLYHWLKKNPKSLPVVKVHEVFKGVMPENILFHGGKKYSIIVMDKLSISDDLLLKQKEIQNSHEWFNHYLEENYNLFWNSYSIVGDLMDSILKENETSQAIIIEFFREERPELLPLVLKIKTILTKIAKKNIYWFDCHEMQFMEDENRELLAIDLDNDHGYRDSVIDCKNRELQTTF